jgi:ribonuclease BN (tRNA processing enzyme)
MAKRIRVDILGDAPLMSEAGKGFSYRVSAGGASYLVDCGANIFSALSKKELQDIAGIFITHAHSDHVRYLADLAFYLQFSGKKPRRLRIITTDRIHAQLRESLMETMDLTLARDRRSVAQIPYEDFFDCVCIGPEPRYHMTMRRMTPGKEPPLAVMSAGGKIVPPSRGKVFMHPKTGRLSMLFKDERTGAWVEPESFYDFSSREFYRAEKRDFWDSGLRVTAVKKGVWHGMTAVGYIFQLGGTRVFFTGDTVADLDLWRRLAEERIARPNTRSAKFRRASFIVDDVAQYVEQAWSADRMKDLDILYGKTATFHECGGGEHVVHTDYVQLEKLWTTVVGDKLEMSSLALIHTPHRLVSRFPIAMPGQAYMIEGGRIAGHEKADYYIKEAASLRRAYKDARGKNCIFRKKVGGFEQLVLGPWRKGCGGKCIRARIT